MLDDVLEELKMTMTMTMEADLAAATWTSQGKLEAFWGRDGKYQKLSRASPDFLFFIYKQITEVVKVKVKVKVYDVTKFLEDHPGGDEVLLSATGKDATDDFEDVGHSDSAREMMNEYYVGEIDSSTIPKKTTYKPPKQPHYNQDKTSEFIIKLLQFLVPLAILGLAVGVRFYTKSA
uniref:Cytochrome b5 heme-binding domain-containing protein n=1 Tax=Quercus lobata TaxID=97700 RepID=A0A7N2R6J8_QUELO